MLSIQRAFAQCERFTIVLDYVLFAAYEVLSDKDKRKQYDRFGESAFTHGGQNNANDFDFNFNDFFKGFDSAFNAHKHGERFSHGNRHNSGFHFDFGGLFDDVDSMFGDDFDSMFGDDDDDMFQQFSFFDDDDDDSMFENNFEFDFGDDMFDNLHFGKLHDRPGAKYQRENNHHNIRQRSHGSHGSSFSFSSSNSNRGTLDYSVFRICILDVSSLYFVITWLT